MAYSQKDINQLMKGRSKDQQSAIKYFVGGGGCLSSSISDQQYESMVMSKAKKLDFKKKALGKIGLDESQVNEIEPVHFEGYYFDEKDTTFVKWGKDRKWRSAAYQISWIFFSSTQIYVYQYTYYMTENTKKETTEEYFYRDITNFSTSTDTIDKLVLEKTSCTGVPSFDNRNVDSNRFALVVPGDKFYCSMEQNDYTERAIQGMKAKLREKKQQ